MIREYYRLAKPGIVYGNVLSAVAGYLFATKLQFDPIVIMVLVSMTIGLSLVIGSAAVFNNYLDRDMDMKMERTRMRALVTGAISVRAAIIYGTILGLLGISILFLFVNSLAASIALFGWLSYVIVYGKAKRATHWAAVVGSVPGAVPIVTGYAAFTNHLDFAALLLFAVMVAWQMPHFYAIAIRRLNEYTEAGIPVLPAKKGIRATKVHILGYVIAFVIASVALFAFGYAGYLYLVVMLAIGLSWLWRSIRGFKAKDDAVWARDLFLYSLIVLLVFLAAIAVGPALP